MLDVEPVIVEELQRLSPLEDGLRGEWEAVLAAARPLRRRRRTAAVRIGLALAVLMAVAVPTVAFSAGVRSFLGFHGPLPKYQAAQLRVSAPLPGHRVARLWTSPSTQGGECWFVTFGPAGSRPRAKALVSGGFGCTVGRAKITGPLMWTLSFGEQLPSVFSGRIDPSLHPAHVVLRWHGGSKTLPMHGGYFVVSGTVLANPRFERLPFDVVAVDAGGKTVASRRIPTSMLYRGWKQVAPSLHRYRVAHDCPKTGDIWSCLTR